MPTPQLAPGPLVAILLCTYNGARYLEEQLASYEAQTHGNWALWVSDDSSQDGTLEILGRWKTRWEGHHDVHLVDGPQKGSTANFLSLLCHPDLPPCYVALSDQDDIWHAEKLALGLDGLALFPTDQPALYGAQSVYTNADLRPIGRSKVPSRPPDFANALTQNIVSGHSATLNPAGLALVRRAGANKPCAFHDWWLYQLITGAGGWVMVDTRAVLSYRQHAGNVLGAHRGRLANLRRLGMVFGGRYGQWIDGNLAALDQVSDLLLPQHQATVSQLLDAPRGLRRFWFMIRAGLYRQSALSTALFYMAALFGRI